MSIPGMSHLFSNKVIQVPVCRVVDVPEENKNTVNPPLRAGKKDRKLWGCDYLLAETLTLHTQSSRWSFFK